jgi:hypothetical protein
VARLRFYERFGVRALAIPYFQPRLSAGLRRGYHMVLGVLEAPAAAPATSLDGRRVRQFLEEYFEAAEGPGWDRDPEVAWLLQACGPGPVELVPLHDLSLVPEGAPPWGADGTG